MAIITLSNGAQAFVDDADFLFVSQWRWKQHREGYPYRNMRRKGTPDKFTNLYMHRLLMDATTGQEVDHIDRNPLNNCRNNLRFVSHGENMHNKIQRGNTTTGHRGITKPFGRNRYTATIRLNGQRYWLGSFLTQEEAVAAYKAKRQEFAIVQP